MSTIDPSVIQDQLAERDSTLNFPLNLRMRIFAIAPQCYIERPHGRPVAYMRQKLFKFTEEMQIFKDSHQERLMYRIKADRIIDFSAQYHFFSVKKGLIGYTKQQGFASLWRTQFDVHDDTGTRFFIKHQNPWTELIENLLILIPIVGIFFRVISGYVLNPTYIVTNLAGDEVATMTCIPSFWEGKFELRRLEPLSNLDQERIILSLLTLLFMQDGGHDGDDGGSD